jgi:hypothetical protein
MAAGPLRAAEAETVVVDVDAAVASSANLTLGVSAIRFPDASPDTTPSIPAQENPVSVTASAQTGKRNRVTLTVTALMDLTSGGNTIPIGNVSWTATGPGFVSGSMARLSPQQAGSWQGSGTRTGSFAYFLQNSWDYKAGSYSAITVYTLYAP